MRRSSIDEQQEAERYFKRAEFKERWFRRIGMPTRILVYLICLILIWVLSYGFIDTKDFSERPLGSLTLRELWNNLLPVLIAGGGTVMMIRSFFAEADGGLDDGVDWGRRRLKSLSCMVMTSYRCGRKPWLRSRN